MAFGKRKMTPVFDCGGIADRPDVIASMLSRARAFELIDDLNLSIEDATDALISDDEISGRRLQSRGQASSAIKRIRAGLPEECVVDVFWLVPEACFENHRQFLYGTLELLPYAPWNMLVLPKTRMSSFLLDIDVLLPKRAPSIQLEVAAEFVGALEKRYMTAFDALSEVGCDDDADLRSRLLHTKIEAQRAMIALADVVARAYFGERIVHNSRKFLFDPFKLTR